MSAKRLEAFSDGVIAIIITVMVLSLRQPHGVTFGALRPLASSFLAYALSFVYLAIYWNNHHHLLATARRVNAGMLWSNLNLLFWLSLIPFCTDWIATNHFARQPVAAYGVVLTMAALAYFILQHFVVVSQRPDQSLAELLGHDHKGKLSLIGYLASIPLSLWSRWWGIGVFILVAIAWLIPDRRIEHYIDHHAPSEE